MRRNCVGVGASKTPSAALLKVRLEQAVEGVAVIQRSSIGKA
jgi:hypothetical protein